VNEVRDHLFRCEVVEQAQHALEQRTVLATAHLPGHDDPRVSSAVSVPLRVQWSEIANVVGEDGPFICRGADELFLVGGSVIACLFCRQDVVSSIAQLDGPSVS